MPIGMAITIIYSSPILTTFLAYFFMGETITQWDILSLVASFMGVIILNKPFDSDYKWDNSNQIYIGTCICVVSAIASGTSNAIMRHMRHDIHYAAGPTYFSIGCSLLSPLVIFYQLQSKTIAHQIEHPTVYDLSSVCLLIACSIFSFFGHIL